MFTSGSKREDKVGSGFCVYRENSVNKKSKYKLSYQCTLFQSQLFAIHKALEYLKDSKFRNELFNIYCNCTAIQAIENCHSVNQLIQSINSNIRIIINTGNSVLFSENSHSSNPDCVREAQELANYGSLSHQSMAYDLVRSSYVKKIIRNRNIQIWNERWLNSSTGSQNRQFIPSVEYRLKIYNHFKTDYVLTQFLSGHGKFNTYLNRFPIKSNSICDKCGANEQNVLHIIFDCSQVQQNREELKKVCEQNFQWPIEPYMLLNEKIFENFKKFCNSIIN